MIDFPDIVYICSQVIIITTFLGTVWKIILPLKKKFDLIDQLDERSKKDFILRQRQEDFNNHLARAMVVSLTYMSGGDHTGELRKEAKNLTDYLIAR